MWRATASPESCEIVVRSCCAAQCEAKAEEDAAILTRGAADLAAALRALPGAGDADSLRGVEGEAARQYFAALNALIRISAQSFQHGWPQPTPATGPDQCPALLRIFAADERLSFSYRNLRPDPQVGFLHVVRPGRAALALDLMEEFRAFADRLVLSLINRGQISVDDFVERRRWCCATRRRYAQDRTGRLSGTQAGKPKASTAQRNRAFWLCCRISRPACWRARYVAIRQNICPWYADHAGHCLLRRQY